MSENNPTVIVADDHPLLMKGLCDFLVEEGLEVLGMATDGLKAFELIKEFRPDLAILDLKMPKMTGLQIAEKCAAESLPTRIILLTLHKELYLYHKAKELNLSGYILKEFALSDLSKAIAKVLSGEQFFSERLFENNQALQAAGDPNSLTRSEVKIIRMIADGARTKEIAEQLFISERTVEKHRSNIINKLQLDKKHNSLLLWAQKNREIIG